MMLRTVRRSIAAFLLLGCTAAAAGPPQDPVVHHSFADAERWAKVFDDPARDEWQKPLIVLDLLGIQDGDVVADLGAGTGYFTGLLSLAVGEDGRVYAVDLEQSMLDHLMKRSDLRPERVRPVLAEPDDPKLPAGQIDLVLVVNTWHHIDKRPKYLRRLARCLSPEGRVVVIDYREGELPVGPPAGHKLAREAVIEEFQKAKWNLVAESVALPYQYFLTFAPPRKRPPAVFRADE